MSATTADAVLRAIDARAAAIDAANRSVAAVACRRLAAIILEAHPEAEAVRLVRGKALLHLGDVRFSENRRLRFWRANLLASDEVLALEVHIRDHAAATSSPVWATALDDAGWLDLAKLATTPA